MIELTLAWRDAVLAHLGVAAGQPDQALLERLVKAYICTVPWESAFRMAKRALTAETAVCPRWPEEFWGDNLAHGGGGTCYESNYAFFALLQALGYQAYLTINNMNESIGCHTAIVVRLDGQKWLTDVGIPLYAPLPLSARGIMHRSTQFSNYTVTPLGDELYEITRSPHPSPYIFTLIDRPVTNEEYRAATMADYGPGGLFLDSVIINKIVNGRPWRFNTRERPLCLNSFHNSVRTDREIEGDVATFVGSHFGMDPATIQAALNFMNK